MSKKLWKHKNKGAWVIFAILLYLYINIFKNAIIDDTYITLCYVKSILASGTWGFFPNYTTNTASSPLNVILLTLISLLTGPTTDAVILLALICLLGITFLLTRIAQHMFGSAIFGYLAAVAFICNPLLISTLGLESMLFAMFFIASIYFYITEKWEFLAIALGLLTMTRADGFLFFFVFFIARSKTKHRLAFLALYLLSITPWYLFSWIKLGSFIPDTFFIKKAQGAWDTWNFLNGWLLYYKTYPLQTILSVVFLPFTLLPWFKGVEKMQKVVAITILLALVHFLGYALLGVPPYHWYYTPEITAVILLGGLGLGHSYRNNHVKKWGAKTTRGLIITCFIIPPLGMFYMLSAKHFVIREMPIHTNWATQEQYKKIGLSLKKSAAGNVIAAPGEIGTLAFYCDCYLLDPFSDRTWMKDIVYITTADQNFLSALFRMNFLFFASNQEFPRPSYILRYSSRTALRTSEKTINEWNTNTTWRTDGLIILENAK